MFLGSTDVERSGRFRASAASCDVGGRRAIRYQVWDRTLDGGKLLTARERLLVSRRNRTFNQQIKSLKAE